MKCKQCGCELHEDVQRWPERLNRPNTVTVECKNAACALHYVTRDKATYAETDFSIYLQEGE